MKSNNFGYLLKEGIRGIFLHGFMSFAAVCVTVACLVIIGSFSVLLYNLNIMVAEVEQDAEILVYIDESFTEAEAKSVGSKINMIENVHQATFVSRQQALEEFVAKQGDESAFQGIQADVLRDRFLVTLEDNNKMKETVPMIEAVSGVAEVNAPYRVAEAFATIQHILRIVSAAVIALLLVVSLLIISNTVKLAMYDRRDEIAIMKMVGATNSFIRFPFVVEGFLLGMFGAAVAFFLEWGLYNAMVGWIASVDALNLLQFVPFMELIWPMVATFGAAGLFVGIFGSFTSIRKFLDV
ncbi:MAG: permease-like cell division protein FtsX [Oscillospiraceae bacterium]|jgi:cell division transport system permease protein|nr:permease-like cell division protein FtsX [Bacillota bacterium]